MLARIPQSTGEAGGSGFDFPEQNLKPDSLQYVKENALGMAFLNQTMMGTYKLGEQEVTAYYTRAGDPMQSYQSYLAFARENGEIKDEADAGGGKLAVLDIFGATEMILATPGVFCGLQSVPDVEQGKALLLSLAERAAPKGGRE